LSIKIGLDGENPRQTLKYHLSSSFPRLTFILSFSTSLPTSPACPALGEAQANGEMRSVCNSSFLSLLPSHTFSPAPAWILPETTVPPRNIHLLWCGVLYTSLKGISTLAL